MKRFQASSPSVSSPKHKKAKTNAGIVQDVETTEASAGEWTKVEKRKQKKIKKTEVNKLQDV